MKDHKSIRAVLTEPELIEQYERTLYEKNKSERQLIEEALEHYFEQNQQRGMTTI